MSSELPRAPGIYQIRCLPTGKVYVGSAVDLHHRWSVHRRNLRKGEHGNKHLQAAWNKFGEEQFECSVLEYVEVERLLEVEQSWIDRTRCFDAEIGFNALDRAVAHGRGIGYSWEGFVDPEGNEVLIQNLQEFCRKYNLNVRAMMALADPNHKLKQHKGWTHKDSPRKRDYIKTWKGFIDPGGNEVAPIVNLKEFCRQHGLDATHMVALVKGRICSHKGWTHRDGRAREREKTYNGFINPEGARVIIVNLAAFCRANNLHPVKMHHLKSGKIKQYKGWTWRPDDGHEAS
jgi:group I intron endonuclease